MDLTTLFAAISLAFGLLTFETIRTSDRVIVETADLPRIERTSIDQVTVEQEFADQLNKMAKIIITRNTGTPLTPCLTFLSPRDFGSHAVTYIV